MTEREAQHLLEFLVCADGDFKIVLSKENHTILTTRNGEQFDLTLSKRNGDKGTAPRR